METTQAPDFAELARRMVSAANAQASTEDRAVGAAVVAQQDRPVLEDRPISPPDDPEPASRKLEDLPKELGVLLTSVGVLGFVLPGIAGTPALIAGGLVLWPKTFGQVESWFSRRYPVAHRKSMQQVGRFLDDLEGRYPQPDEPRS